MSGKYYMLVNPYIEGTTPKIFNADNSQLAAKKAYESMSKYFNNSVHNFNFTLLKIKSEDVQENAKKINLQQYGGDSSNKRFNKKNFSHFTVSEKLKKNGEVDFSINQYNGQVNNLEHLVSNVMKIQDKFKKARKNTTSTSDSQTQTQSQSQTESQSESYSQTQSDSQSQSSQQGGAKKSKYDDDEDEDDSPDYFVSKTYYYDPISYWYYLPSVYPLDRLYLPTFVSPLSFPYVLDLSPSIIYGTGMSPNPSVNVTY